MSSVTWIDFADDSCDMLWFAINVNLLFVPGVLKLVQKNSTQLSETLIVLLILHSSNVNITYILKKGLTDRCRLVGDIEDYVYLEGDNISPFICKF